MGRDLGRSPLSAPAGASEGSSACDSLGRRAPAETSASCKRVLIIRPWAGRGRFLLGLGGSGAAVPAGCRGAVRRRRLDPGREFDSGGL